MKSIAPACVFACVLTSSATAATFVLDFEGLENLEPVNGFYNGGAGGEGSSGGQNVGVQFTTNSLAIVDQDAGGDGNFANEPSPKTILFFLSGGAATMNVADGFDTGFSFYYTSVNYDGFVTVWDELDGAGNKLAELPLSALGSAGNGDPLGTFDTWDAVGVSFLGTARSIDFGGTVDQIGFDNVTFGSETPIPTVPSQDPDTNPSPVPLPASLPLLVFGTGLLGVTRRWAKR